MTDSSASLEDVARAAGRGETSAQRALYTRLYPYGMSIALHYAGQRTEAEEIMQDAYVKFFKYLGREELSGSCRSFFSRIVINTSIDLLRKRNRMVLTQEIDESRLPKGNYCRNTGTDRIEEEEIYRLLQMLPPAYRLAFNLHVLEGYSHPEIARRLSISEGASRSNLHKARKKLQTLAAAYYQINDDAKVR